LSRIQRGRAYIKLQTATSKTTLAVIEKRVSIKDVGDYDQEMESLIVGDKSGARKNKKEKR